MIMLLTREKKEQLVTEMTNHLENSKTMVLVNFQGLKVKEIQELKKKLREQGIGFQIVKNSLLKIALKNKNLSFEETLLDQPVAIVWGGEDEVLPAKITAEFGKTAENLTILGGIVNLSFADVSMIKQLASLPSREELYAKLTGTLNAPISRLVNVLHGNLRSLVYILDQYQKQRA